MSFEGFTSTPEYQTILFGTSRRISVASGLTGIILYFTGLGVFFVSFAIVIRLVMLASGGNGHWTVLARGFAPTVLPIAVAYEFAHCYLYVIENLGVSFGLVLGLLAGATPRVQLLGWLSLPAL